MESLGTGVQRGFSPSCPRSQRFHRWSPPESFLKVKSNIDNKKTGKMILPVFLLSISRKALLTINFQL